MEAELGPDLSWHDSFRKDATLANTANLEARSVGGLPVTLRRRSAQGCGRV